MIPASLGLNHEMERRTGDRGVAGVEWSARPHASREDAASGGGIATGSPGLVRGIRRRQWVVAWGDRWRIAGGDRWRRLASGRGGAKAGRGGGGEEAAATIAGKGKELGAWGRARRGQRQRRAAGGGGGGRRRGRDPGGGGGRVRGWLGEEKRKKKKRFGG